MTQVPQWIEKVNVEKLAEVEELAAKHGLNFLAEIRKCDAWWRERHPRKCGLNARWMSRLTNWINNAVEFKLERSTPRARGFQPQSHQVRERKAIG